MQISSSSRFKAAVVLPEEGETFHSTIARAIEQQFSREHTAQLSKQTEENEEFDKNYTRVKPVFYHPVYGDSASARLRF